MRRRTVRPGTYSPQKTLNLRMNIEEQSKQLIVGRSAVIAHQGGPSGPALRHVLAELDMSRAEVERHFKLLRGFLTRALSGFHVELEESFEAFDAARRIHEIKSDLANVRLVFVTDGVVRSADVEKEQLPGFATSYEFWDLKELRNLAAGEPEPIELDFAKNHGGRFGAGAGEMSDGCAMFDLGAALPVFRYWNQYRPVPGMPTDMYFLPSGEQP